MKKTLIAVLVALLLGWNGAAEAAEQRLETVGEAYAAQAQVCRWEQVAVTTSDWRVCEQYLYELLGLANQEMDLAQAAPQLEGEMRALISQISAVMMATASLTN